jgi:hypothetical protein
MTDEQFKMLRAMQFAQLALLQSIEANMRHLAQQQVPAAPARTSIREARTLLAKVMAKGGRGGAAR